jgi:hypothetical protein
MKAEMLSGWISYADETVIQVLHELGRSAVGSISCCMITARPEADIMLSIFLEIIPDMRRNILSDYFVLRIR